MVRPVNERVAGFFPKTLCEFICEDKKSMCYYLEGLRKVIKDNICIKIIHSYEGTGALSVWKCAQNELKKLRENQENLGEGSKVVVCFDKDDNKICDIKNIAKEINNENTEQKDVVLVYTAPCYEYWLLLHIEATKRRFTTSKECSQYCLNKIKKQYSKQFSSVKKFKQYPHIFDIVGKDLPKAIQNAKSLNFSNDDLDGTYTNAHLVLEEIIKMAE